MHKEILLDHEVRLHPKDFGPGCKEALMKILRGEVEGTCSKEHGFFISVQSIEKIGLGMLPPGEGVAVIPVKYRVTVFKPFIGQVLDGVVIIVHKHGIFTKIGPLECFIPGKEIMDMQYSDKVQSYISLDEKGQVIGKGFKIPIKIVGLRFDDDTNRILAVGSLMID